MSKLTPLKKAVLLAGNQTRLAMLCGVTQPTITKWLKKGLVPPRQVLRVEQVTGIPRWELNPLIYPRET